MIATKGFSRRSRLAILGVLLIAPMLFSQPATAPKPAPGVDAFEPNDSPDKATPLALENEVSATLFPRGDRDFYKFTIDTASRVTVRVTGPSPAISLVARLTNEQGQGLAERNAGPGRNLLLVADVRAGKYLLEIRDGPHEEFDRPRGYDSGESRTPYHLQVSAEKAPDPSKPNDAQAKAHLLELGKPTDVCLFPAGDQAFFRVKVPEPGIGDVRLSLTGVPENISPRFVVTYPNKSTPSQQGALGKPFFCTFHAQGPGDYDIQLYSADYHQDGGWTSGASQGALQPMQLKAEFLGADDPFEPNNDFEHAAPLPLGKAVTGTLFPASDIDYFKLNIPEGHRGLLRVDVTGLPDSIHPRLDLFDKDRRRIRDLTRDHGKPITLIRGLAPGDYYLSLSNAEFHNGLAWEGSEANSSRTRYTLRADFQAAPTSEHEPNDTFETAEEIKLGEPRTATLVPEADYDFFQFTLKEGEPDWVQIMVSGLNSRVLTRVWLYNQGRQRLSVSRVDRDGYHVLNARLSPGTYYLQVGPEYASNGAYNEGQDTAFQNKPYSLAVIPLYRNTQPIENSAHHLGDRKVDSFTKPEAEGLTYRQTFDVTNPAAHDTIVIATRSVRNDAPAELGSFLDINGKEIGWLNRHVSVWDGQWRTLLIDLPPGLLKAGQNEVVLRTKRVEGQGTENWEFRYVGLGQRLFYRDGDKVSAAATRAELAPVPATEGSLLKPAALAWGRWQEFRATTQPAEYWCVADVTSRGFARFLLPGPHAECEPTPTLYRVQGDHTQPLPRVLYLRGSTNRTRLDEFFPELAFTRVDFNAKEAAGILLNLQSLLAFDAIIIDGLNTVTQFDIASEKSQANLQKFAEAGKRVLFVDPLCELSKIGVKNSAWGEVERNRTLDLPTSDPLFAGDRGSALGWPGRSNGGRIENWKESGLTPLSTDAADPAKWAVTAYKPVGKGALIFETMLPGNPENYPQARQRLQWLLGLRTRFEVVGQVPEAEPPGGREGAKLWTSPILIPGKYLLHLRADGVQHAAAASMVFRSEFFPVESAPGGEGRQFATAHAVELADKPVTRSDKIDEYDREQWYRLKTSRGKSAAVRVEAPEKLDLAVDVYRGSLKPTGKRVLYLHGPVDGFNLDAYFPDIQWDRRQWNAPQAARILLDPLALKGCDAVIVDTINNLDQFGLNQPAVLKAVDAFVQGGGRFIMLSPACALAGFEIKSENPGQGTVSQTSCLGDAHELLSAYKGPRGSLHYCPTDEIGAFSGWDGTGYAPLFRHTDNADKWATAVAKKAGQGYYILDTQRLGADETRGLSDWKLYLYLGVTPSAQYLRTVHTTFGRTFGSPQQFELPAEDTEWFLRVVDWKKCHRSAEPFQLTVDPAPTASSEKLNNSRDTAAPLPFGTTVQGRLFPAGDARVYRLEVDALGLLRVSLDHPADNIDGELTLTPAKIPQRKVLYLRGGRAEYDLFRRRLAGVQFTVLEPNQGESFAELLPRFDTVILDGLFDPRYYGIGSPRIQEMILKYVENGGTFVLLCPQLRQLPETAFWGTKVAAGFRKGNVVVVDPNHPLHRRQASGTVTGWPNSESYGCFTGCKAAGFHIIYGDTSDKENNATFAVKNIGKGMFILDALEIGYPGNAEAGFWNLANMVDAPRQIILDGDGGIRRGVPRFDERIVEPGSYFLTVADNTTTDNFVNASPVPYALRADFSPLPELADDQADAKAPPEPAPATAPATAPAAAGAVVPVIAKGHDLAPASPATVLLYPPGKAAWYRFGSPQPGKVILSLTGVPDALDPIVEVYRASDLAKPWRMFNNTTGKTYGGPEYGEFETNSSEAFYVKVYDREGIHPSFAALRLKMDFVPVDCPFQPNSDSKTAAPLVPGYAYHANIYPARSSNWFRFEAGEKAAFAVSCREVPADLAVRMEVFSADHLTAPLQQVEGKPGSNTDLKVELPKAGTYFLVMRAGGEGAPSPDLFEFKADYQPAGALPAVKVAAMWPAPDLLGSFAAAPVKVSFTKPIKAEGIEKSLALVGSKSGPIAGKAELDPKTNILTFRPSAPLSPGERVTVTLAGIKDVDNQDLAAKAEWAFAVGTPKAAETVVAVALDRRKLGAGKHSVVLSSADPLPTPPVISCRLSDGTIIAITDLVRKEDGKWHGTLTLPATAANGPARIEVAGKDSVGRNLQRITGDVRPEVNTLAPPAIPPVTLVQRIQGKVGINWARPPDAAGLIGYRLIRATRDNPDPADMTLIAEIPSADTIAYEDLPPADGTYFYAIVAVDDAGNVGPLSRFASGRSVRAGPKLAVQEFAGKVEKNRVILNWRKTTEAGVAGYSLHRFSHQEDLGKLDAARPYRNLTLDEQQTVDLPVDGEYFYVLVARDAAGNIGPPSPPVKVTVDTVPAHAAIALDKDPPWAEGDHAVTIKLTKRLKAPLLLKVVLPNSEARDVPVKSADGLTYQASVTLTKTDPVGTLHFITDGEDLFGNTGVPIDANEWVPFDNGPAHVRIATEPEGRFKSGTVKVSIDFNKPLVADPTVSFKAAGKSYPLPLKKEREQRYTAVMELAKTFPNGPAEFEVTATDRFGHAGAIFDSPREFVVKTHPPAPPAALRVRPAASNTLEVRWNPPLAENVAFFRLYVGDRADFAAAPANLAQDTIYDVTFVYKAKDEKPIFLRVTSVDAAGNESAPTAAVRAEPRGTPPPPPTDVIAKVQKDGQVKLSWTAPAVKEEIRFAVFRSKDQNPDLAHLKPFITTKDPTALDRPPEAGAYIYAVCAEDFAGNLSAAAQSIKLTYDVQPPLATLHLTPVHRSFDYYGPGGVLWRLEVVNAGKLQVSLTFDKHLAEAPQLRYRTRLFDTPHEIALMPAGDGYAGEIEISRAKEDGILQFLVSSKDAAGNSGSAFAAGERFWIDTTPPEAPAAVTVERMPLGKLAVSWAVPQGEQGNLLRYHLYRGPKPLATVDGVKPLTIVDGEQRFVDSPAEEGEYVYTVVAEDLAGNFSPPSASSAALSKVTPPAAPTALTATLESQVRLTWMPSKEKAAHYRVYRAASEEAIRTGQRIADGLAETALGDLPQTDGTLFYAVTALDSSGNESAPSNIASIKFVGRVPRAAIVADPKIVRSAFKVVATTTLPLVEIPQLFLEHPSRSDPIALKKSDASGTRWEGNFDLPENYPSGAVRFSFRGLAAGGFAGTTIDSGADLVVDTTPPTARVVFSRQSPLPAGTHEVTLIASEPLAATPQLIVTTLGAKPRRIELQKVDAQTYRGALTLTPQDHDGTAVFTFQGVDLAGNEGRIDKLAPFEINNRVPKPPTDLKAHSAPAGAVQLVWQSPVYRADEQFDPIAGFNLYRSDKPIETIEGVQPVASRVGGSRVADVPPKDGDYFYALATVHASGLLSAPTKSIQARSNRTPPSPPHITGLKPLAAGMRIEWATDDATSVDALRFNVEVRSQSQPAPVLAFKELTATHADYSPMLSGEYVFRVIAIDAAGNLSSPSLPQSIQFEQLTPVASLTFSKPLPWGEGPVDISLSINRALTEPPSLVLSVGEKQVPIELSGSGTQWKGRLVVDKGWNAESGEFHFRAQVREKDANLEGTAIAEGREARFNFNPPTIALDFGSGIPTKDRRAFLTAGKHEFSIESSALLSEPPKLTFTAQGKPSQAIELVEAAPGRKWLGTLLVDEKTGDGVALFEFTGVDAQGNVGKEITAGRNVVIRTHPPGRVGSLRAISMPLGRVRLDWTSPLVPDREPGAAVNHFRVYRSDSRIRSIDGLTPLVDRRGVLGYMDTPPADREYFYTVVALDEAGNAGETAPAVSVHVDRTPPGAPTNLVVSELPTGSVKLSWNAPTGKAAAYYRVYLEKFPIRSIRGLQPKNDCVPFTEVYGSPNENGKYYYAVTAIDQALNEGEPSNVAFHEYKSIAPMAFFTISRGDGAVDGEGTLTVQTPVALSQPPQLMVKSATGEPRRISLIGGGKTWSARIVPTVVFPPQNAEGAEASYTLELTTEAPLPALPAVFYHGQVGDPHAIAFGGEGRTLSASLVPTSFFRFDPRIWLTDGKYTITLWTTQPLREPPKVTLHSETLSPQPLAFTGGDVHWQALLQIDDHFPAGQYGFEFNGTDAQGNVGTEIRVGPLFRVDRTPPLPPEKLELVANDSFGPGTVRLRWSPPQAAGAKIPHFYRIYRGASEFEDPAKADLVREFRVEFEGKDVEEMLDVPPANGTWCYRLTSVDLAGNESGPSALAKVTVSTNTPSAEIRVTTPQSGDAPALRVGKGGAVVVLNTNVPLKSTPRLQWMLKSKPADKHHIPLTGSDARFEGSFKVELPDELEEDAEFIFSGVSADGGVQGTGIRSGRAFIADTVGPEARIIIPSVYEMKIVAKPEGGGELQVPPVRGGRIAVDVELSETPADLPELHYSLNNAPAIAVPLTGFGRNWHGVMDIPEGIPHAAGKFFFKSVDTSGNVSTKITRREYPREVDETSFPPQTLRNFATTGGEFEVVSILPEAPHSVILAARKLGVTEVRWEAPETGAWTYRLYRSLTPLVGKPATDPIKTDILARLMVDDPPAGGTYFYAVTAVDLAGNESPLSECPSIFIQSIKPELKIKAVVDGDDFVVLFPDEEPSPTAEISLHFPGQKDFNVSLGGDSGELKKITRMVDGKPVPGYVMPRKAEFFNGKVEVVVHSPDPAGNMVEALTETAYNQINTEVGGEVESADGSVKLEIPAGLHPSIPAGPKEYKRVGGYDNLFFISHERIAPTDPQSPTTQAAADPDPVPPGLDVVGAPYTIHLNNAPKEPMTFKSSATQADLSGLKLLMPKLTMKIPATYSDIVKDPEYLKTRLKVIKWVPTPENTNHRGHWEMVSDVEVKTDTGELITPADSITTYVIVSERTPPTILDATPEPNGSTRSLRPTISARIIDKGTGVATAAETPIILSIDGQKIGANLVKLTTDDPTEVRLTYDPPADLAPGMHLVSLRAEDVVRNVANYQWRFTVSARPPVIAGIRPAEGEALAIARPVLSALLTADGGINAEQTHLTLDGVEAAASELSFDEPSGLLTWAPSIDLPAGDHAVTLAIEDRAKQAVQRTWRFTTGRDLPALEAPTLRDGLLQLRIHSRLGAIDEARLRLVVAGKPVPKSDAGDAFTWETDTGTLTYRPPPELGKTPFPITVFAQDVWGANRRASWLVAEGQPPVAIDTESGQPPPAVHRSNEVVGPVNIAAAEPAQTPPSTQERSSAGKWMWAIAIVVVLAIGATLWHRRRLRAAVPAQKTRFK